jgi:hypothetical protein
MQLKAKQSHHCNESISQLTEQSVYVGLFLVNEGRHDISHPEHHDGQQEQNYERFIHSCQQALKSNVGNSRYQCLLGCESVLSAEINGILEC